MSTKTWRVMVSAATLIAIYQVYCMIRRKQRKLPPGPSDLMMLYFLAKMFVIKRTFDPMYFNKQFMKGYDKHGVVYHSLFIFNGLQISSSKMAKKILNHKNALDRPVFAKKNHSQSKYYLDIESTADGTKPFPNVNGTEWERRRKLAQSILFRMCTQSKFINKVCKEALINVVFPQLNKLCDDKQLWYPSSLMKYCAFNTIHYANNGEHMDINDPIYDRILYVITETFQLFQSGIIYSTLPKWIMFFIALNPYSDYYKIINIMKQREQLSKDLKAIREQKDKQKQTQKRDDNKEATYYIDYIRNELTESEVSADMGALIAAGTDTTSSSLNFAIIFSAKYPNLQTKIRNELIECYNKNNVNKYNFSDYNGIKEFHINWTNQLTYFRAYVYEVLRVSSVVKFGLPHYASGDIWVNLNDDNNDNNKVCIPKGTLIAFNIESMHKNTNKNNENWVNSSSEMCLENWINPNTKKFELNESFLTFGAGRRDCVGRTLAIKEIYIIMAYLLLNYKFSFKNRDINEPIKTLFNGVNVIDPPIAVVVEHI